ncbi:MAG: hypothetical protein MK116_13265 [Phycisphaerales bacterium]|nr:hypothetical protein [Phycisphaerales bacterium]
MSLGFLFRWTGGVLLVTGIIAILFGTFFTWDDTGLRMVSCKVNLENLRGWIQILWPMAPGAFLVTVGCLLKDDGR